MVDNSDSDLFTLMVGHEEFDAGLTTLTSCHKTLFLCRKYCIELNYCLLTELGK